MSTQGLALAIGLIVLGGVMVVFRRKIGGLSRFNTISPPELRGWGYWEKLIPNEGVAWSLGEMSTLITGVLLIVIGVAGIVMMFLGLG